MLIEIFGAGFKNKGAQLMLETVVERLRRRDGATEFCMEASRRENAAFLAKRGFKSFPMRTHGGRLRGTPPAVFASRLLGDWAPRRLLDRRSQVRRSDPDALVNIAGFAYGDAWSVKKTRRFTARARFYKSQGKPVVLLPQMLGTFNKPAHADAMRALYDAVDMIYARDRMSFECVEALVGPDAARLRRAPDLTIFAEPASDVAIPEEKYACLVPNMRVLDRGGDEWVGGYVNRYVTAAKQCFTHGLKCFIVVHDASGHDQQLADQLVDVLGRDRIAVFADESPRRLKAFIQGSELIVASRFHSVVAALSCGVPAIVLGWAHKYEMLLNDFGVDEMINRADDDPSKLVKVIEQTLEPVNAGAIRSRLRAKKAAMKETADAMWREVSELVGIK